MNGLCVYRVGTLQARCLDIQLDRAVYRPMLARLREARRREELQRDLIAADGPLEIMRALFGVGSREYTRLRRLLTFDPAVGRPPEPDEVTSHALWRAWSELTGQGEPLNAEDHLALGERTGASLRTVWHGRRLFFEPCAVVAGRPLSNLFRRRPASPPLDVTQLRRQ